NAADSRKLDEVISAVRDIEADIQCEETWINVPKPKVAMARPEPQIITPSARHMQAMFDLIHAAFLTDSTRVVTYELPDNFSKEYTHGEQHAFTHWRTLEQWQDSIALDRSLSKQLAGLFKLLCESKDHDGQTLMQHTAGVYGSGVWGTTHGLRNLPIML